MIQTINIQEHLDIYNITNPVELTCKIIRLIQQGGSFVLTSTGEGFDFNENGLYELLDTICKNFNLKKNQITLETWNLIESHPYYNIRIINEIFACSNFSNPCSVELIDYKIGLLLGRSNHARLMAYDLWDKSKKDKFIFTFHQNLQTSPWPSGIHDYIISGGNYKNIEQKLPYTDIGETLTTPIVSPYNIFGLKETYKKIALEIVIETVTKQGFFITEKTLRPIFYGRPFLIVGPKNFDYNLQKLGFITNFNFPFDISDFYHLDKLNLIFAKINDWYLNIDQAKWFNSLDNILKHNQSVLKSYAVNQGKIANSIINQLK